jgi:hypothetical protein
VVGLQLQNKHEEEKNAVVRWLTKVDVKVVQLHIQLALQEKS